MSATGPELPPHLLAKRKRQQAEEQKDEPATSSGANHDKRRRLSDPDLAEQSSSQPAGPQLPPASAPVPPPSESIPAPVRRVAGPAPPPAPLDERPTAPLDSDSEDSDDDFGPALPSAADAQSPNDHNGPSLPQAEAAPVRAQRDEWMTLPPQQDDLAARMDPSKLRARGFNTGKSARGGGAAGSASISAAWTETPEQKLKRLQDEAMGVKPVSVSGTDAAEAARSKEREAEANRLRERTAKARGPSLMEQHQDTNPQEKEDDPSKRAFDREKDIGGGGLNSTQKKEMLNKASNFTSKFSGGGYL